VGVAHAGSPECGSEDNDRQEKEDAGHFEPEDSANAAKWPQEAPYALADAARGVSGDPTRILPGGPALHGRSRWLDWARLRHASGRLRRGYDPLPRDPPGDPHSNAQNPANISRFHTVYDGSSGS
jgi:hypothetical protein